MLKIAVFASILVAFQPSIALSNQNITNVERRAVIDAVKSKLIDPYSAKIKITKNVANTVCGLVNAKNSFGGYVGERWFIASWNYNDGKAHGPNVVAVIFDQGVSNPAYCETP